MTDSQKWVAIDFNDYLAANPKCSLVVTEANGGSEKLGVSPMISFVISPADGGKTLAFCTSAERIKPIDSSGNWFQNSYSDEEYQALPESDRVRLRPINNLELRGELK